MRLRSEQVLEGVLCYAVTCLLVAVCQYTEQKHIGQHNLSARQDPERQQKLVPRGTLQWGSCSLQDSVYSMTFWT